MRAPKNPVFDYFLEGKGKAVCDEQSIVTDNIFENWLLSDSG